MSRVKTNVYSYCGDASKSYVMNELINKFYFANEGIDHGLKNNTRLTRLCDPMKKKSLR